MNILLIFFALPIATVILAAILEKILHCPLAVGAAFFAIYLVVTFAAFDATFLIATITYIFCLEQIKQENTLTSLDTVTIDTPIKDKSQKKDVLKKSVLIIFQEYKNKKKSNTFKMSKKEGVTHEEDEEK